MTGRGCGRAVGPHKCARPEHQCQTRGRWAQDTTGRHIPCLSRPGVSYAGITIPDPYHFVRLSDANKVESTISEAHHRPPIDTSDCTSSSSFMELPTEIRLLIYSYLVQTGCVFYATPAHLRYKDDKTYTSLTKFIPKDAVEHHPRIASLLCVNRKIKEECYELLYGENVFVIRESGTRHISSVYAASTLFATGLQAWTKVLLGQPPPFWPLTGATLPYVKEASLLVTPQCGQIKADHVRLRTRLQIVVNHLSHCRKLQKLDVIISEQGDRSGWPSICHIMKIDMSDQATLQVSFTESRPTSVQAKHKQYTLEPLANLRGLHTVSVSGFVDPDFATKLSYVMMSEDLPELQESPLAGVMEKCPERRKSGGAKRRKVNRPVLHYWDARLDWSQVATERDTLREADATCS